MERNGIAMLPYVFRRGAEFIVEMDIVPYIRSVVILDGKKEGHGEKRDIVNIPLQTRVTLCQEIR
jgi:hypothetical protein